MTPIPQDVLNSIPSKWVVYATTGWVALQAAGRVYHAVVSGGGLISIWHALLYGTNTPTMKEFVTEADRQAEVTQKKES
jgi:hypothetical protein